MKYQKIVRAEFISRPNRFVAQVRLNGTEIPVHVKNTGRCRELLVPGAQVFLEDFTSRMGSRKLMYDLVAVKKGELLINMDSQAPNKAVREALESGLLKLPEMAELTKIRPETVYGDSRFDFYIQDKCGNEGFAEVKGVTLEAEGVASFPDAPTERGVKHLYELIRAKENGFYASVIFVIQMEGMKYFTPNDERHHEFGEALRYAEKMGVNILAFECRTTPDSLTLTKEVEVKLK